MMRPARILALLVLHFIFQISPQLLFGTVTASASSSEYVVIGIDSSGSMRGAALEEAVRTAEEFVARIGEERRLEIFTFARSVNKVDSASSLTQIEGGGYTSLYDSIWTLAQSSRALGAPLIIITDGRDSRSSLTPDRLYDLLQDLGVPVNIIAYQPRVEDEEILTQIAIRTSGSLYGVDTSDQLIETLTDVVDEVEIMTDPATNDESSEQRAAFVIASATGLLSLSLLEMLRRWRIRSTFLDSSGDLLDQYEVRNQRVVSEEQEPSAKKSGGLSNLLRRSVRRLIGDTSILYPELKDPVRRQFSVFAIAIALFASLMLIGFSLLPAIASSSVILALIMKALVSRSEGKMRAQFEKELPGAMKLIASSLTAGLSFLQALDTFSSEGKSQVAREFRRALSEIQMGSPIERAFGDVADRMRNEDLRWVVFAFSVQREVGGSLAKILQTSAETIEARASLRQEIRTLSAEGRISSYILILLPPSIFVFLLVTKPDFIALFWQETIGHILLGLIVLFMILSWTWIKRLIRIEA